MSAERSLSQLLEDVAAQTPAPGGGSVSGWVCALAASLVEMTAAFEAKHSDRLAEIAGRATALRAHAGELAELELHAYEPVLAALATPKDDPMRTERLDAALSEAAETPLELARAASARDRARHPRPRLVRLAAGLLPDVVRTRLRQMVAGASDTESIRAVGVDELWYSDADLDMALDLQAICLGPDRISHASAGAPED